jgi:precorrin-2 C20-methyltransferase/precorrin-3B C17-methyltransferase
MAGGKSMGRFFAVGVGPGDPELLTLKAVRVLRGAAVVLHAGPAENQGRALEIVRDIIGSEQRVYAVLGQPMGQVSASDWRAQYRPGVDQIAAECHRGNDVAFITEGDPTLYSTAANVWQLLAELHPDVAIEIIPGVSSITAAAARVGWPLARKDDMLAVVPAAYHARELRHLLHSFPTVCFLKPGRVLLQIVETLREMGPGHEAVYLEELGTPSERIAYDLREGVGRERYFAMVLARRNPKDRATSRVEDETSLSAGKIAVVGLGPGDPQLLTHQALTILREAHVIIGYDGYLRALPTLSLKAEMLGYPLGAEAERAGKALELAEAGRRVALVSSGDAGVYGMASLLLETAEQMPDIDVEVVPGVTAAVAAAALLGAPLGHDFACISLSDLLTPWEVIERRLETAGRGDFVLALYNPVSRRRTWQLPRTREILSNYRRPETPVGLVDRAFRPGARVWQTALAELTAEGVGMETILIIGNSQTRLVNGRMVTPRGYGDRT